MERRRDLGGTGRGPIWNRDSAGRRGVENAESAGPAASRRPRWRWARSSSPRDPPTSAGGPRRGKPRKAAKGEPGCFVQLTPGVETCRGTSRTACHEWNLDTGARPAPPSAGLPDPDDAGIRTLARRGNRDAGRGERAQVGGTEGEPKGPTAKAARVRRGAPSPGRATRGPGCFGRARSRGGGEGCVRWPR